MKSFRACVTASAALAMAGPIFAGAPAFKPDDPARRPVVQMAILLDTSGSMQGLIDQAKSQLWAVVSELATARRGELRPELQVALYEYGKSSLSGESGFIRQILPLTTDLDKVSEELFALTTNGGEEYCGWVIQQATNELAWSQNTRDLKMIFIAGNEPFTQGPVNYRDSVPAAIAKGIVVNTVHCGDRMTGIQGEWESGSKLADGQFTNIDTNATTPQIPTPQDAELAALNVSLNATYIPFGAAGSEGWGRQRAQDANSEQSGNSSNAQRINAKASALYFCSWDLVDACREGQIKLADIKAEDLPEIMRPMTLAQREAHLKKCGEERAAIQTRIQTIAKAREAFIAAELKKLGEQTATLESALIKCMRDQAIAKGLEFEKKE